ncbi:GTPase RsgA, partial [Francisella tularensis]|uniref:GTPase RsgA n=1 Tax=Francisella tularensis TaxID=263 RepID=UPI002381BCA2
SDIEPIIVINKIDDQSKNDRHHLQCIIDIYKNIGYKIFYISAKNNFGIDSLLEELKDKTSNFLGQSGVGKSEPLNTILGEKI